jgi:L-lysine 6-transaminase
MRLTRQCLSSIKSLQNNGYLVDSYPIMWSIKNSHGSWVHTEKGDMYLDFHGGYGSNPIGWNHPKLIERMSKDIELFSNKPANGDFYSRSLADFVDRMKTKVIPEEYEWMFFIDGGALAVENALKVAMDWKCQLTGDDRATRIIHLQNAFHGRSGYTMSLTNTDPHKIKYFPKFEWPRLQNLPYMNESNTEEYQARKDVECIQELERMTARSRNHIAGMIIEPIQGEGGDNYFTPRFLKMIQKFCNDNEILLICDEVQTGFFSTGKPWAFQHYDIEPDIVVFGKKSQQCGIFGGGPRLALKQGGCFTESGRISSTWSGNLTDMVRSTHIIDIIHENHLSENATQRGEQWNSEMKDIQSKYDISNIRNKGLWLAFDMDTTERRNKLLEIMKEQRLLGLASGTHTIRFRPNLATTTDDVSACVIRTENSLRLLQ